MTEQRNGGIALIAGSIAGIITMAFHPTGHDLFVPGNLLHASRMVVGTHALALISLPIMFLGALALWKRLARDQGQLALLALVFYAFALVATLAAATFSGLVAPQAAEKIVESSGAEAEQWRVLMHYNGDLNRGFAQVLVVASSIAILLWSIAIVRSRVLAAVVGIYGCAISALTTIVLVSGHLRLNVHGFGMVVLTQAVWFVTVGVLMIQSVGPTAKEAS